MASGEKIRSHSEANQELFERIGRYSEEIKEAKEKQRLGRVAIDSFFSQFDTPTSRPRKQAPDHDIEVSAYNPDLDAPHDINVQVYDPDSPDPEPEPSKPSQTEPLRHIEPPHEISVSLYDPDSETTAEREKGLNFELMSEQEIKDVFNQTGFKSVEAMDYVAGHAAPKYKVNKIGGAEIYLSEVIPHKKRPHVVVYTKAEGEDAIRPNLFYRSRSSMLWRFLPQLRGNGGYGKSNYEEDAINAPFELQSIIEEIYADERKDPDYANKYSDSESVKNICDKIDSELTPDKKGEGNISGIVGRKQFGNQYSLTPTLEDVWGELQLPDPQECVVPDNLMPNFDKVESEWQTGNDVYKKATARRFKSRDGSLEYLIFQYDQGRAWVGAVECTDSKISPIGLREKFVVPGALTTPLYEYGKQAKGSGIYWGNLHDSIDRYVGMDRYLNKIPLIQEFNRYYGGHQSEPSKPPKSPKTTTKVYGRID